MPQPTPPGRWAGLVDVLTRVPLIVVMYFISQASIRRLVGIFAHRAHTTPLTFALDITADAAFLSFALTICILAALRLQPVRKAKGLLPRATALVGGFMLTILASAPRIEAVPDQVKLASVVLLCIGNLVMAFSLFYLGRSFSIMPEARRLVTDGPYGLIRHPLYVAEAFATLGSFLIYLSWPAAALCLLQTLLQLGRIHYEEQVLRQAFPDYESYARRVPRFIPRFSR